MKVYTRTGDQGMTSLIGGKRVPKQHRRIEAYGTVDELIAHIGLTRDYCPDQSKKSELLNIQSKLMICASWLAADCEGCHEKLPEILDQDIVDLEQSIDEMESHLSPLTKFVLPGGHIAVSQCHVARTVCRRAERKTLSLSEDFIVDQKVLKYLNRLSDYLFVLARYLSNMLSVKEDLWLPSK